MRNQDTSREFAFQLTFNSPAARTFIPADTTGLQFEHTDKGVMVRPVANETGDNITEMKQRERGGYATLVEGSEAETLYNAIKHNHGPYYSIQSDEDGLMKLIPYTSKVEPSRFVPYARLWKKTKAVAPQRKARPSSKVQINFTADDMVRIVRDSFNLLETPRHAGRPSKELIFAREVKTGFEQLVSELVQPAQVDMSELQSAKTLIGTFLNKIDHTSEHHA